MGGSVSPAGPLPGYNTGNLPATNAPPQQGAADHPSLAGSVYTPKFGMPSYIGAYLPQSDVSFMNTVPGLLQGSQQLQGINQSWNPAIGNQQMQQPTSYSPALTSALGNNMSTQAAGLAGPVTGALLNSGFDPQNALYARTAGLLTDQIRAAEAAQGVAGTPYGASVEGQNMADFNMNWVNQEQQRQQAAAQAAGGWLSGMNQEIGAGQQLAQAGPSFQTSLQSTQLGNAIQALSPLQIAASDYLSYMGQNQQAQLTASQQNIAGVSTLLDFIAQTSGSSGGGGGGKGGGSQGAGQIGSMMGMKGGGK